jgi:hypothetical protein
MENLSNIIKTVDHAALAQKDTKGGIDLAVAGALSVRNNGQGIHFDIDPAQLSRLQNLDGFIPVIINIRPLGNLRSFLGINAENSFTSP